MRPRLPRAALALGAVIVVVAGGGLRRSVALAAPAGAGAISSPGSMRMAMSESDSMGTAMSPAPPPPGVGPLRPARGAGGAPLRERGDRERGDRDRGDSDRVVPLLPAAWDDRWAPVPAFVRAEYGALRRPRRPADRIAVHRLGRLPESGILAAGIRMLATVPAGGRAYLVPSLHLLAAPMRPVRCVPPAQRARQASLLATLRHEYAQQGLCLVVVYRRGPVDNCGAAPGTVASDWRMKLVPKSFSCCSESPCPESASCRIGTLDAL